MRADLNKKIVLVIILLSMTIACEKSDQEISIEPIKFAGLPNWNSDKLIEVWPIFIRSCHHIKSLQTDIVFENGQKASDWQRVWESGQHIMVVVGVPTVNTRKIDWIEVPIFDSTTEGRHGPEDIRYTKGGIGAGRISLGLNNVGVPIKIKWSPESKHTIDNPHVAMAHLT